MNIYDFDKTIYAKDSSIEFTIFALKSKTILVVPAFVKFIIIYILYKMKIVPKIKAKEAMFGFLPRIKNLDQFIAEFWDGKTLDDWYLEQKQKDDVVISASPRFLITPILKKNHVNHIIASEVDPKTGKFLSKNCYGEEKVARFRAEYSRNRAESAYSDSLSDAPMLNLAKNKYLVMRKNKSVQIRECGLGGNDF